MINEMICNDGFEINIKNGNIYIKNYKVIYSIDNYKIFIGLNNVNIIVRGTNLIINKMDKYDLKIIGNLKGIEFTSE